MSQPDDIITLARRLARNEIAAWRSIYQAPQAEVTKALGIGCAEIGGALWIWNRAGSVPILNRIFSLGVFEPATDTLIDELLARGLAVTKRCYVHIDPIAQPTDLLARIETRGLRRAPEWLVHYHALDSALPATPPTPGYHLDLVTPATIATWADALLAAWDFPAWAAAGALAIVLPLLGDPAWTCFAAVHEASGQIAGGGALFVAENVGGLYLDGVRPEHRRHGLHEALIVARLTEARRQACTLLCSHTQVAHPAQHAMARAGFEIAYERLNYMMPK